LLSATDTAQPWDAVIASEARQSSGSGQTSGLPRFARNDEAIASRRAAADPHNPAITAILDCVEFGLPQSFEGAIRSEMAIFAALIQRPEPRNMIQTLFLGKTDYERAARKEALPAAIAGIVAAAQAVPGDKAEAATLHAISAAAAPLGATLSSQEKRMADYACVAQAGFPAFLGGPFTFAERGFA
jgi:3-hydroxyacyl-CoA dehydrogenase/enoyl-CoA hydratase/3-hydroxybutyryl-CoA epimerase